jgi:hypothetical protein
MSLNDLPTFYLDHYLSDITGEGVNVTGQLFADILIISV